MTRRAGGAATLHDVAREAGVSLATASRALNGSARTVNPEYRDRVLQAATKLDYRANVSAQAVARGTSATVALLVGDIADPFFSSIAAGVIQAADAAGLIVTMAVTERSPERELELVRALRGQRPRVLILTGSRGASGPADADLAAELDDYRSRGGRVVMISQPELPFDTVMIDNRAGARALGTTLLDLGYRRFAVIAGSADLLTSRDRLDGFTSALADRGVLLDDDAVVRASYTRDDGYSAARSLIAGGIDRFDAAFAMSDVLALGAMRAFRDAGIRVPDQIAIAGFNDYPVAQDVAPALTTVRVPLSELGRMALELALGDVHRTVESVVMVPTEIVVRASTPPVAGRALL